MSRLKHSRKSQVLAAAFAMDGARKIPKDESEANEQFLHRIVQYTEEEAQRRFLQTITHHTAVSRAEAKGVDCCLVPYFLFVCQSISYYGCVVHFKSVFLVCCGCCFHCCCCSCCG